MLVRFPALRRVNLRKVIGHWQCVGEAPILARRPGQGHDLWLQEFSWGDDVGEYTRLRYAKDEERLYFGQHECACGFVPDCLVSCFLLLF